MLALLAAILIGYAAMCCFFFYAHHGRLFDFRLASYRATADASLLDFVLKPISILAVPMMIPILAILMAWLIAIPLLVAQFFGVLVAIPLLACLLLLAHLPVMSFYLLLGCIAVGVRRLRLKFLYANTLVALCFMGLYIYIATRSNAPELAELPRPSDRLLLYLPWILALIAAALLTALMLAIARLLSSRPRLPLALLAALTLVPAILYATLVGRDELSYRLLEGTFGPRSLVRLTDRTFYGLTPASIEEIIENGYDELARAQIEIQVQGKDFLAAHARSRHAASVLFLIARTLDTRPDLATLRSSGRLVYYDTHPAPASRPYWQKLVDEHGRGVFALIARERIAAFLLRDGETLEALNILREAHALHQQGALRVPAAPQRDDWSDLLRASPPTDQFRLDLDSQAQRIEQTIRLLEQNAGSNPTATTRQAFADWFSLDPRHERYPEQLRRFARQHAASELADNAAVELAACLPPEQQGHAYSAILEQHGHGDGAREALLRLAKWYLARAEARGDRQYFLHTRSMLEQLERAHPESSQARSARALLQTLGLPQS